MMMNSEYVLELISVFHTGQVEPGTCFQKLMGNVPTGVILKDVSLEVHGGELMAIMGSKGSGKRALLEVISRRAQGPTKGQILLNHVPMSLKLFQESCAYVTHRTQLIEGITTYQTLLYSAKMNLSEKMTSKYRESRVKQVLADLALIHVANRKVENLTPSEYRRVVIGVQMIKDPIVMLLDEPAWGLDPLNTYLIVSILSNHAKKYNRIMVVTMEKPRSDIFPFLDRATYLCLGDVVYTGSTRLMLDYFRSIGFPCPELENPLMYYLCLSTVDRRSRDRFIDSNNQIAALVERFRGEGGPFRKYAGPTSDVEQSEIKVPLSAYGRPWFITVMITLLCRMWRLCLPTGQVGLKQFYLRLLLLPTYFFLLWNFYFGMKDYQHSFQSRGGLLFNCIAGTAFLSAAISAKTFSPHRTRYYHESREGTYYGPVFVITYAVFSMPLSFISTMGASAIVYFGLDLGKDSSNPYIGWLLFGSILWTIYGFVEQQTAALMLFIKSSYNATATCVSITSVYLLMASATLRSLVYYDNFYYLTYGIIFRYVSAFLHEQMFDNKFSHFGFNSTISCESNNGAYGCRYSNGSFYLLERFHISGFSPSDDMRNDDLAFYRNFGVPFAFVGLMTAFNIVLYLVPLPAFIKSKFRE
ncbi:UNVERIFIED_CONTAM: hypothetical protein RMT77_014170 [Armadillidium vulgare]